MLLTIVGTLNSSGKLYLSFFHSQNVNTASPYTPVLHCARQEMHFFLEKIRGILNGNRLLLINLPLEERQKLFETKFNHLKLF